MEESKGGNWKPKFHCGAILHMAVIRFDFLVCLYFDADRLPGERVMKNNVGPCSNIKGVAT